MASFDEAAAIGWIDGRRARRAGRSRERQASEEFDSVVASGGQSRHDISMQHPPARAVSGVYAWNRLRSSDCGVNRIPTQDGVRRKTNLRPRARSQRDPCEQSLWSSKTSGAPSTCNP